MHHTNISIFCAITGSKELLPACIKVSLVTIVSPDEVNSIDHLIKKATLQDLTSCRSHQ